jgi:hypothetical protein
MQEKTKGSNKTPSLRQYRCFDKRKMKRGVEAIKRFHGISGKLPVAMRSAVAYFAGGKAVQNTETQS